MTKSIMRFIISAGVLVLTGCGGGDGGGLPSQPATCDQVVSIQVAPQQPFLKGVSSDQLPVGVSAQYEATLTYCDGSTKVTTDGVKWSVSNANATISASGVVSTVAVGSVQIIASLDNLVGERTLDISGGTLTGLTITPPSATIPKGLTQSYTVQGTYSDGSTLDVTSLVAWSSSTPTVASINTAGVATGVTEGSTTVTAMLNGQSASASLNVTAAVLTGLTITPPSATIPKGLTQSYTVQGTYSDGSTLDVTSLVAWSSSAPTISTVSAAGVATGITAGSTTLTALLDGISATGSLTVTNQGSVVTWGHPALGGDSSSVQAQLTNVQTIFSPAGAFAGAFAALKQDGTVVTWGLANGGGDSSAVQAQLTNVQTIYAANYAFAALKQDGTVVTWGDITIGADSSAVQAQLTNVQTIFSTGYAFAALKQDGTVVTWGLATQGGDSSAVQAQLTNVQTIFSAGDGAFAALKQDGTVVTWGLATQGGDSSAVQAQLTNVQTIFSTDRGAFAALKQDGTVVTWGNITNGGDSSAVQGQLTNVQTIFNSAYSFGALLGP